MSRLSYVLPIHRDDPRALTFVQTRLLHESESMVWGTASRHERAAGNLKLHDLVPSPIPACYVRYSTLLVSCLISAPQKSAMSNADLEWDAELLDVEAVLAGGSYKRPSQSEEAV